MTAIPSLARHDAPDATDFRADWQRRLAVIVDMMKELSRQTDPQAMVRAYAARVREIRPSDASISLSRRDLAAPHYRITRSTRWNDEVNPWRQPDRLPLLAGGVLADLIYGDQPRIIDDLAVGPDDPAYEYLAGHHSLAALPLYDGGHALNMVVQLRREPGAFSRDDFPELVWMSNLFGRATHNLVLRDQLRDAYNEIEHELEVIANIQRSLLPARLPDVPGLTLAADYRTSRRAGGDYYDVFALPDQRWGLFIADVSGHGTPAAVLMAITHCLARTCQQAWLSPTGLLEHLNHHLFERYTVGTGTFVTAFYGIFDAASRTLCYANAGHPPPRLQRHGAPVSGLDVDHGLPLGIIGDETYRESCLRLCPGDQIILYTDGITEAHGPAGDMFGEERLDRVLGGCGDAGDLIRKVLTAVNEFTAGRSPQDDCTLLVATVPCE